MSWLALLDFGSVMIFALTGALVASRAQMDPVGFLFIACLTAMGGGTLRDVLLDRNPVFWIAQPTYIAVACGAAIVVFFTAHLLESRLRTLLWLDSLALAIAVPDGHDHRLYGRPDARRGGRRRARGAETGRTLRLGGLRRRAGAVADVDLHRHRPACTGRRRGRHVGLACRITGLWLATAHLPLDAAKILTPAPSLVQKILPEGPVGYLRQWVGTMINAPMLDTIAFSPALLKPKPNISRTK